MPALDRRLRALACIAAVACRASGPAGPALGAPAATADSGLAADSGGGEPAAPGADEAAVRAAMSGARSPAEVVAEVAARGGLPVETSTGSFLFLCECGPGVWSFAGDGTGWSPVPMVALGGGWAALELDLGDAEGQRYKFTDGQAWIADPWGRRFAYDDFGRISVVRSGEAHLERWFGVAAAGLAPRPVDVWVPAGGRFTHLLVAQDGQNLFDPAALHGGWRLDAALPPGVLVAAVHNTAARFDEYTFAPDDVGLGAPVGGRSADYAALVHEAVLPLIEAAYGSGAVRGLLGSSLGGLVSLDLAHRDPAAWDAALSLSGTLGWGSIGLDGPTLVDALATAGPAGPVLYLDAGGGGPCADEDGDGVPDDAPESSDNWCENAWARDRLAAAGYTLGADLFHWWEPGAPHTEAAWAARVSRPLDLFAAR